MLYNGWAIGIKRVACVHEHGSGARRLHGRRDGFDGLMSAV